MILSIVAVEELAQQTKAYTCPGFESCLSKPMSRMLETPIKRKLTSSQMEPLLWIRIRMFLGLPDPLVTSTNPALDPSITKQK
jgi:hypothetical protein